jgi:Transcriptional regulator PadR-like family
LYPLLGRLRREGMVQSSWRESASGPPRRYYRITTDRRSWREWAAVILLPLGGFAFGVGWLVGLVLLWSSRLWTTRDKLIGTLIVPGGIATALIVLGLTGTTRRCRRFATPVNPSTGALVEPATMHCTPSAGPSAATTALQIALVVFFVLGPVASAVYLARRARGRPVLVAASRL